MSSGNERYINKVIIIIIIVIIIIIIIITICSEHNFGPGF